MMLRLRNQETSKMLIGAGKAWNSGRGEVAYSVLGTLKSSLVTSPYFLKIKLPIKFIFSNFVSAEAIF